MNWTYKQKDKMCLIVADRNSSMDENKQALLSDQDNEYKQEHVKHTVWVNTNMH